MDPSKLQLAPWSIGGTTYRPSGPKVNVWTKPDEGMQSGQMVVENVAPDVGKFIALARNAFDFWAKRDPAAALLWLTDTEKWYNERVRTGAVNA